MFKVSGLWTYFYKYSAYRIRLTEIFTKHQCALSILHEVKLSSSTAEFSLCCVMLCYVILCSGQFRHTRMLKHGNSLYQWQFIGHYREEVMVASANVHVKYSSSHRFFLFIFLQYLSHCTVINVSCAVLTF